MYCSDSFVLQARSAKHYGVPLGLNIGELPLSPSPYSFKLSTATPIDYSQVFLFEIKRQSELHLFRQEWNEPKHTTHYGGFNGFENQTSKYSK